MRNKKSPFIVLLAVVIVALCIFWIGTDKGDSGDDKADNTETKTTTVATQAETEAPEAPADESAQTGDPMNHIKNWFASSSLYEEKYDVEHGPAEAFDGRVDTAWVEDQPGYGGGESIGLEFTEECMVSGIFINAGYQKSEELYYKNNRPKEIGVFIDGDLYNYEVLQDTYGVQTISFDSPVKASRIELSIETVYSGNKYDDTCISEIEFY